VKSYRALGEKAVIGAKKAAKAVERTGRKVVQDNPEITEGAKQMAKGARDIGKGVAKGLPKEVLDVVSRKIKAKTDKQDKQ